MQLSQKRKVFSNFFLFCKFTFHFEHFQKKALIADVFLKLRTRKTWLHKSLKNPVLEDPLTSNMVNGPKHC